MSKLPQAVPDDEVDHASIAIDCDSFRIAELDIPPIRFQYWVYNQHATPKAIVTEVEEFFGAHPCSTAAMKSWDGQCASYQIPFRPGDLTLEQLVHWSTTGAVPKGMAAKASPVDPNVQKALTGYRNSTGWRGHFHVLPGELADGLRNWVLENSPAGAESTVVAGGSYVPLPMIRNNQTTVAAGFLADAPNSPFTKTES
eukprot:TRINITY_DN66518_c7_g1_i2.p2 TRINITY_DN66518_c7_g1~~TRINITY_DN66518_c7_g1_i2.p2  ORF type:complete len:199 (-),score=20.85 TRINITY_DN66518_c7_g1_i2:1265-1861(-)